MAGRENIFDHFRKRLEGLKSPGFMATLAQRCGDAAVKATADCFRESRDPYGKPWAPLKLRKGKPLLDRGLLAASINRQPGPGWFRLLAPRIGAATHQFGATIRPVRAKALAFGVRGRKGKFFAQKVEIPARPFFPTTEGGIPDKMRVAFEDEYRELAVERLGL